MKQKVLLGVALASVAMAFAAVQLKSGSNADTSQAVANANWADNVTITIDDDENTFRFQSNGIPSHGFAEKYLIPNDVGSMPFSDNAPEEFTVVKSSEYFQETEVDTTITTQPTYIESTTDTTLGRIGVAITGAQIFNDYEDMERSITALDDNVVHDHVPFVDECNGHTLVDGTNYHYHGIPLCITGELDQEGQHSTMIGVLEDGFPVYGNHGTAGAIVTNDDLDECSGHFGSTPEFPEGIYHYHLTADEAPYMINCYHGDVGDLAKQGHPQGQGTDFSEAAVALNVTQDEIRQALGQEMPPNFADAAEKLGVTEEALRAALPPPPQH
ncbi:YHYH protein [Marinomonas sp. GJ51-6]|uniref:YHYH protein n=1 Tax=Marinomonas sp. GJ51-6 TaxID=2992802 RepID=UPI00293472D7|nr:YHYH protein [Marinomonas sp. GJ51-6]WOD07697.1 YHYH protein [Marinomonas sp. GJ51-6]